MGGGTGGSQCRRCKKRGLIPGSGRFPWRRAQQSTSVFLPGKSHGQRNLAGYSPWGCKELDVTELTGAVFHYGIQKPCGVPPGRRFGGSVLISLG